MLTFEYCLHAKVFHCLRDAAGFAPGSFWKRVEIATDFPVNLHCPALVWRYQFFSAFIRAFTKYSGRPDTAVCFVRGRDLCTLCAAQRQDKRDPVKQARCRAERCSVATEIRSLSPQPADVMTLLVRWPVWPAYTWSTWCSSLTLELWFYIRKLITIKK